MRECRPRKAAADESARGWSSHRSLTRRCLLSAASGATLIACVPRRARATPETMTQAMREALGDKPVTVGRVTVDVPQIAENGNSVPLIVTVDSPMTPDHHVAAIYLFSDKNPSANIVHFHLSPRSGRARVQTNIRLATTQTVTAIARMSDGSLWSGTADVIVTIAACLDET
jgi:sulfur-oxidizing protein SoxY